MFFEYDENNGIQVPAPFNRVMTPFMTTDTTSHTLPFSVHMTEWEPGCQVDPHLHENAMEAMYFLSGTARAMVNDEWYDCRPHSMIVADKMEPHCIINTGSEKLRVLCIFSPAVSAEDLRSRAMEAVKKYEEEQSGK